MAPWDEQPFLVDDPGFDPWTVSKYGGSGPGGGQISMTLEDWAASGYKVPEGFVPINVAAGGGLVGVRFEPESNFPGGPDRGGAGGGKSSNGGGSPGGGAAWREEFRRRLIAGLLNGTYSVSDLWGPEGMVGQHKFDWLSKAGVEGLTLGDPGVGHTDPYVQLKEQLHALIKGEPVGPPDPKPKNPPGDVNTIQPFPAGSTGAGGTKFPAPHLNNPYTTGSDGTVFGPDGGVLASPIFNPVSQTTWTPWGSYTPGTPGFNKWGEPVHWGPGQAATNASGPSPLGLLSGGTFTGGLDGMPGVGPGARKGTGFSGGGETLNQDGSYQGQNWSPGGAVYDSLHPGGGLNTAPGFPDPKPIHAQGAFPQYSAFAGKKKKPVLPAY